MMKIITSNKFGAFVWSLPFLYIITRALELYLLAHMIGIVIAILLFSLLFLMFIPF